MCKIYELEPSEIIGKLKAAGHTQTAIKQATGIGQPALSRMYQGKQKGITLATFRKLVGYAKEHLQE